MKIITIKSSVLSAAIITGLISGANAHAGVFDQLAAVANTALPSYGRVLPLSAHLGLEPEQMEAGIREIIILGSNRVATGFEASYQSGAVSLSRDMRRARKMAIKLGHEEQFAQLQKQMDAAVIAAVPATSELLKAALKNVEFSAPRKVLTSHDTAATDFVRRRLTLSLYRQFQPLLSGILADSGATATTAELAPQIQFGGLLGNIVEQHVMVQAIDGFFDRLEIEESAIRQNPELRTTTTLKRVFG